MSETEREVDQISGVETTGHEWDGIKELDNPMPRWWLWTFYACCVWGLLYTIAYPAWPLISASTSGLTGWSARADLDADIARAEAANADRIAAIEAASVAEILADASLRTYANAAGAAHFKVNCVQCHGAGAAGGIGYPNLNDDAWIWGGSPEAIYTTLRHGIRWEQDWDTRLGEMPRFGVDGVLSRAEISDVAWYVVSLSKPADDAPAAARGAALYSENCAACHGALGEGIQDLGGPRLSDAIWLYGGSHEEIVAQIWEPRLGVMPGWLERLGDRGVKEVSVYVHGLGGGEPSAAE
ncbi:MAG: cytochrome-c oxidase, cbb3-type subunit III [Pseudomonadota bacterium]